jgi:transglutaminase-like putative cysteine protease
MTDTSTIANKGLMSRLRRKQKELMASSASGGVQPHTDSGFNPAIPTIAGTAAGLGNNVDAIYSFVANNIEFIPVWGVQKGALGCLIDGAGNAFDQSALLVALLQAAGYNAQFLYGSIQLNVTQLDAWLNTTNPLQPAR